MKLLLDQGLPQSAAGLLRNRGHDAVHTGEIGFARAEDAEILAFAEQEARIVFTLDADFHLTAGHQRRCRPLGRPYPYRAGAS